ncbi:MAG TPA: DNA-3-methyladenine glycosylase [Candidatus Saccharimonadales bacterium]|nr:DNA-3-methyladenine glycosylase [Candidatus Saccharimonadales bacterium]
MNIASPEELKKAAKYLSEHDPVLAPVIKNAGLATFNPHDDYYGALVNSIIGQQLSVKAAASIKRRFQDLFDGKLPTPKEILEKSEDELRGAGLSRPKIKYISDLAQHIIDGKINFKKLNTLSNEEIVAELTDVKGLGEWTAHMFLMFCMGRLDVLAHGDLGIRNGIRRLYNLAELPSPDAVDEIALANNWHPYESVACWYVWHSLDNEPTI